MNLKRNLHWILYPLFVASCAKQTSPTGGPKDTIPPVLVTSVPQQEAINFKGNSVELHFSEMVILNNPKEQLIATPTIGKNYEITNKKNSVKINFDTSLEDSTTYTLNFRDAIQDITEKNPVRNLQVAFSTGPYIDSLSIAGNAYDLLKGKELKDVIVAIHLHNDTFSILKHPATYFTRTDDKGKFKIDHLKPGQYYLYAVGDKNRNLIADSRTELYGFQSDPIHLIKDTSDIAVGLIKLDTRPLKITSARPYNTYLNIKTTKNIKHFNITAHDSTEIYYSYGDDRSNIKIYNTSPGADSVAINFTAIDSIENKIDTTLYAKYSTREVIPEKFDISLNSSSIIADKGLLQALITFTKPVKTINFDSLYFQVDSITQINFSIEDLSWDRQTNKLTIRKSLDKNLFLPKPQSEKISPPPADTLQQQKVERNNKPASPPPISNQLYMGTAAFLSVENDSSKRIAQKVSPLKTEDLSRIIYEIGTAYENIVVQLLDKNLTVLKEIQDNTKDQFEDLTAGDYLLRVVIDRNNNGKWDPGNYLINKEPEPIIYYKDEKDSFIINLKANWDFELAPMLITY